MLKFDGNIWGLRFWSKINKMSAGAISLGLFICLTVALSSCSGGNGDHKPVDELGAPLTKGSGLGGDISFESVKPVFQTYCSRCHPGVGPGNFLDYNSVMSVVQNGKLKRRLVVEKSMPQQGSQEANQIPQSARDLVATWIAAGAPREAGNGEQSGTTKKTLPPESGPVNPKALLVSKCVGCHGEQGIAPSANTDQDYQVPGTVIYPHLAGQTKGYLVRQLQSFKRGGRVSSVMNGIAKDLKDEEIATLAEYFSSQRYSTFPRPPAKDDGISSALEITAYERGRELADNNACLSCHGSQGVQGSSVDDSQQYPSLFGQKRGYIFSQLNKFYLKKDRGSDGDSPQAGLMASMVGALVESLPGFESGTAEEAALKGATEFFNDLAIFFERSPITE